MENSIFLEISLLITIATIIAIVMRVLKQPLIIGYITTGIIVGPAFFNLVSDPHTIETLGKFGITLLLFVVGLGLNPKIIKELGKVAVITGVGQVSFTTLFGFLIARSLGFDVTSSVYIAIALAFSSTIVILKLLSDKKEQNQLHGRIAIGFLLVQDIIATIALLIASASGRGDVSFFSISKLLGIGVVLIGATFVISRLILKPLTNFLSKSQEVLFLFAITWGFGVSAAFLQLGFSLEVGALFAGVALASMPYAQEVASRLKPLRDFFLIVFFISLGAGLQLSSIGAYWWQAILLSALVLVGNPIIVMSLMGILGYTKKVSFKTSLAVAQISEFSLIFLLLGRNNGQISDGVMTLMTLVALITFTISSYMIIYSDSLFKLFERYLSLFERRKPKGDKNQGRVHDAIIFGYKKGGSEFAKSFANLKRSFVVIDYDPEVIDEIHRHGIPYLYGDATDPELLEEAGLHSARSIISTITELEITEFIVRSTINHNPKAVIICSADSATHAARLYELGATYVMMPHTIGTEKISNFISKHGLKKSEFKAFRDKHLLYLAHYIDDLPQKHHRKLGHAIVEKMAELAALTKTTK